MNDFRSMAQDTRFRRHCEKLLYLAPKRGSPSLDENDQLRLTQDEQDELDEMRRSEHGSDPELLRIGWQERLRAARRRFNDPEQVEKIIDLLETANGHE